MHIPHEKITFSVGHLSVSPPGKQDAKAHQNMHNSSGKKKGVQYKPSNW